MQEADTMLITESLLGCVLTQENSSGIVTLEEDGDPQYQSCLD